VVARLTIERGRDVDARGDFTVIIRDDLQVTDEPQRRTGGDGDTEVDIVLPSLLFPRVRSTAYHAPQTTCRTASIYHLPWPTRRLAGRNPSNDQAQESVAQARR
jgi:hypothetical protein